MADETHKDYQEPGGGYLGEPYNDAARRHLLSTFMQHTTDHIYFKDEQSRFTLISQSMARRFGLPSPEAVVGRSDFDFYSAEHARKAYEDEQAIMRTGVPLENREEKETWPDGHTTWVSTSKMPLRDATGRAIGTFGISRDITVRKQTEEELVRYRDHLEERIAERTRELLETNTKLQREVAERQRAEAALLEGERMAAIRSMASGVAVAFNNILDIINAYASSIASNFLPKTHVHEEAQRIIEAARRASGLTERLATMARAHAPSNAEALAPVSLGAVVREATDYLADVLRDQNVTIAVQRPEQLPHVLGARASLVDMLMTLLINAAESMPAGGVVRVDGGERTVVRPPVKGGPAAQPGVYAFLRVRDNGVGMTREVRRRIFEPFFSTKTGDTSFGLGLCFAQSAVQGMNGWIRVNSRPSRGSSFRVFLPRADAPVPTSSPSGPADGRGHTVLVVDDDAAIRTMMQEALARGGYHVLTADGPQTALTLYGRHAAAIDLTIVDAVMHNGGSTRVVKRIRRSAPQACLLMTSGFSRDYVRGVLPPGGWGFLQKPFDADQLVRAVHETMDRYGAVPAP